MVCAHRPFYAIEQTQRQGHRSVRVDGVEGSGIESREQILGCQWFLVHSSSLDSVTHTEGWALGDRLSRAYLRSAFWRSARCFWCSIVASSWLNSFLNAFDASANRSAWSSASRLYLAAASLSRM